jgi:hypothetical protein
MSPKNDPLTDLVGALKQGTVNGNITWEQANTAGTAFIAKRPGGTVTLEGSGGPSMMGGSGLLGAQLSVKLVVKDPTGKKVEEHNAATPDPFTTGGITASLGMLSGSVDVEVIALYSQVHEQVMKAKATMRTLAGEFAQPEPSAAETPERPR